MAKVVGVELCQEAVEDAKFNAGLNGRLPLQTKFDNEEGLF